MSDLATLIDAHLFAYADPDAKRRSAAVQRLWAEEGRLIDPPLTATGRDAISHQAELLLKQFPGHRFVRSSGIDSHHGQARYAWQLRDPAGSLVLEGVDFAQLDGQGRLAQITGFFGALPVLQSAATSVAPAA
ncbi:MAG: nuclear transport factor 2 family protein [Pseudomonadota bacterium]|nr:nuclear transport factor 2 family protein [Pseudomonadota bacterium]